MTKAEEVKLELAEMKRLDVNVPDEAFTLAETETAEGIEGGMTISEIASLCIELAL